MNNFYTSIFHSCYSSICRFHISVLCRSSGLGYIFVLQKTRGRTQSCCLFQCVHKTTICEWWNMCTYTVIILPRFELWKWFILIFIMMRMTSELGTHSLEIPSEQKWTGANRNRNKWTQRRPLLQDVTPKKIFLFFFTAVVTSDLIKRPSFTTIHKKRQILFSSVNSKHYRNGGASSSVGDVDHYVIIRKLPDHVYSAAPLLLCRWEIQTHDFSSVRLSTQGRAL
jgi:hypothetical protein